MAKRLKILVVEDDFISRTMLREMLLPFGECDSATDGAEAVEILKKSYTTTKGGYDLLILDIMMPHVDGHYVLQELRRMEKRRGLGPDEKATVVMVSALDDRQNIMEASVLGQCQAYLTKPVSRLRLEAQLRDLGLIDTPAAE